ncbi:MAG: peptidylprolyl isomerase [Bacteroidota bacterium]|nr:peptidylprolyl isomerase [Bacteroidota bacterium]
MQYKYLLFFLVLLAANIHSKGINAPEDSVIASVGEHKILYSEFANRYTDYILSAGVTDNMMTREGFLNNIIMENLLFWCDDNKKIINDEEYKRNIEWTRKQVLLDYLKDREVYAKITCSEEELQKAFVRLNQKVAARHLYAQTEQEAQYIYKLLKNGADFNSLARQIFQDTTLRNNGGYLGYFTWGDMDPAFEDAAFSLKPGQISEPVKTAYGYSIIKVEDKFENPILLQSEFENKRGMLMRAIKISKKKPTEIAFINSIFDFNKIKFNEKVMDDIFEHFSLIDPNNSEMPFNKKPSKLKALTYENTTYTQSDIENKLKEVPRKLLTGIQSVTDLKYAVGGLLLQDKLVKMADSKGYFNTPDVAIMYNKMVKGVFLETKKEIIARNAVVSDEDIKDFYNENRDVLFRAPDQINVQEIIIDSRPLADSLKLLIDKGSDIGELASKFSLRRQSAEKKGIIGFDDKDKFGMYANLFWQSDINQILGPLKIEDKFGIFKILGKQAGEPVPFDKAKPDVDKFLRIKKGYLLVENYSSKLKETVPVTINKELLGAFTPVK